MSDQITILRHSRNLMTKTWLADGTIKPYADARYFQLDTVEVGDIGALSALLQTLEVNPRACVIRGAYVGDELARQRDAQDFKPGLVRRALDYFDDQPLHTVMIDVDGFEPLSSDPVLDPVSAIDEYVACSLPECFHGVAYHWQLSGSAGHHAKGAGTLRAHVWFYLGTAYASAQIKAWAQANGVPVDMAMFNPVQVHYTAAPVLEQGVVDPVPVRSGFVPGLIDDEVALGIDTVAEVVPPGGRGQRLREVQQDDAAAQRLGELGLVKSVRRDGGLNIECPFADEHTGDSGETATIYFPPHTGGHAQGNFKCLHSHCASRPRHAFLLKIGIDEVVDDFAPVPPDAEAPRAAHKGIPEAQHLITDQANAGRIVAKFGKRLIVAAGRWHTWDGQRWAADEADVYRYACKLSKMINEEAAEWAKKVPADDDERKAYAAVVKGLKEWAKRSEMKATIEAAVQLARKMLAIPDGMLDRDPWLLNCPNGTVDLRTGELKPHHPANYITKLTPVNYNPDAKAPAWHEVLGRVTLEEGTTTQPLASFLQRWFGYCATGATREQQFVVHYGSGSNGKSTILDVIADVLGEYAGTAAPGLLVTGGKDRHPTEIADLFGRRMVTAHETGEGGVLREDFVKQATGGDKIKARYMRADFFEFSPTHKLQLLTNHKPIIKGQDVAIWRRVLLVPYLARFGAREDVVAGRAHFVKDTRIADRLAAEREGVLAWVVRGAMVWAAEGLQPPETVLAASKDYQAEQDRVLQFVSEMCELGLDHSEPLTFGMGGLYAAYVGWCKESGFYPLAKNRLQAELARIVPGYASVCKKEKSDGGRRRDVWRIQGLRLVEAF